MCNERESTCEQQHFTTLKPCPFCGGKEFDYMQAVSGHNLFCPICRGSGWSNAERIEYYPAANPQRVGIDWPFVFYVVFAIVAVAGSFLGVWK